MKSKVMQLMRKGAVTCPEDATVREVAQIMLVNDIRYCVVVNARHEVIGIISSRSILKAYGLDLDRINARDILLPHTETVGPSRELREAVDIMNRKKIEHLIVVPDRPGSRAVLGLLCARDIVDHMASEGEAA